jgi:hypothetical protein
MGLPIWIYDYKAKRYVVFPFHLLETFEDGSRGIREGARTPLRHFFIERYGHLFKRIEYNTAPSGISLNGLALFFDETRYILKECRPPKNPKTGAKWYSEETSQIRKYKRKRK